MERLMKTGFTNLILDYAGQANLHLSGRQAELCRMHIELMLEWNQRLNLTRITTQEETIVKHLLDSLLPSSALPTSGNALDVGTGAGFPGIPLKILSPDLEFTLLDSSRKKVSFLSVVIGRLGLKGLHAVHGRWEDFALVGESKNKFDLITMRAVRLGPQHLSSLASEALCNNGLFAWWAGPESEALSVETAGGVIAQASYSYSLPGISRPRSVLIWKKS